MCPRGCHQCGARHGNKTPRWKQRPTAMRCPEQARHGQWWGVDPMRYNEPWAGIKIVLVVVVKSGDRQHQHPLQDKMCGNAVPLDWLLACPTTNSRPTVLGPRRNPSQGLQDSHWWSSGKIVLEIPRGSFLIFYTAEQDKNHYVWVSIPIFVQ